MKLIRSVLALCALTLAVPAFAQSTYPTPSGPRVQGAVPLTCDTTLTFNPPLRGTANTLVEIVTLTASVTGSVYCNLQGYTGS